MDDSFLEKTAKRSSVDASTPFIEVAE